MSYTLMMSQSALTALAVFCSLVLPCTASTEQPARSSIRAYANVLSLSGNTLILQVTGTLSPCRHHCILACVQDIESQLNFQEAQMPLHSQADTWCALTTSVQKSIQTLFTQTSVCQTAVD